ncbi:hypothetical protein KR044_002706 [Drosophila immigrans]|nr:hypothetical protein KR044_002706 [Drosophila immigrans]
MGIADKATAGDTADQKALKARQRGFLKRRASQGGTWNICTDLQRQWLRRRPRRLVPGSKRTSKGGGGGQSAPKKHVRGWTFFWYSLLPLLGVLCLSCGITMWQNGDVLGKFMQRYASQYQAIVHNKLNYCDRSRSLQGAFSELRANVLNQELALSQLEQALANNQTEIQSIALVGSSGVGKTLTIRLLQEQFPWAENVQSLAWNDYDLDYDDKVREETVARMLQGMAHCGRNLLVIDNLTPMDKDYVSAINAMLAARNDVAFDSSNGNSSISGSGNNTELKQLSIIYVFNLNRLIDDELYDLQLAALQHLPRTTVINYRNFDAADVERCMHHEAQIVGMRVDENNAEEIMRSADPKVSGCKTVRSKVLMYGEVELDDQDAFAETPQD